MRSSIAPVLVILNVATAVILVLVLLQTTGLRGELETTRSELGTLRSEVQAMERGVPMSELSMRLAELENDIEAWVVAFGNDTVPGDTTSPAGGGDAQDEILDRLAEVLRRINALDDRVDEICGNVPVC
jgi:hypothetical protein